MPRLLPAGSAKLLLLPLVAVLALPQARAEDPEDDPEVTSLLQHSLDLRRTRVSSTHDAGAAKLDSNAAAAFELIRQDLTWWLDQGFISAGNAYTGDPMPSGCGRGSMRELTTSLKVWREENPNADGFCYFQNLAWWFAGQGNVTDYRTTGKTDSRQVSLSTGRSGVGKFPENTGPALKLSYDGGNLSWTHVDNFVDLTDDAYCYSLGWLKGQRLDSQLMSDSAAWEALAASECEKIQTDFRFVDEEVTIGAHIFAVGLYMRATACAVSVDCSPVTRRLHHQHVYTKCLLSKNRAAAEMAYCYYKACVMADGRIGHGAECGYDG